MSHFEMKMQRGLNILIAGLMAAVPVHVTASVTKIPGYLRAPASINRAEISLAEPSKIIFAEDGKSLSPELIANFYIIKQEEEKPIDMSVMIPLDMKPTDNSSEVFSQVADKSFGALLKSEAVRSTSLGRAATQVEDKMKTEIALGGNSPQSTQHKLKFNVQAFQATAQVEYTGFTNAAVKYKIAENSMGFEVYDHVIGNKDLVVSHTVSPSDRLSQVSLRWSF